jgi:hypothetical protein
MVKGFALDGFAVEVSCRSFMNILFREWLRTDEFLTEAIEGGCEILFFEALKIIAQDRPLLEAGIFDDACNPKSPPATPSSLEEIEKAIQIMRWQALIDNGEEIPPEAEGETAESIAAKAPAAFKTFGNILPYLLKAACKATHGYPHDAQDAASLAWENMLRHITKRKGGSSPYKGQFAPLPELSAWYSTLPGRMLQNLKRKSSAAGKETLTGTGDISKAIEINPATRRGTTGQPIGEEQPRLGPHREPQFDAPGILGREEEADQVLKAIHGLKNPQKALALLYSYGFVPEKELEGEDPWAKGHFSQMNFRPGFSVKSQQRSRNDVVAMFDRRALAKREDYLKDMLGEEGNLSTLHYVLDNSDEKSREVSEKIRRMTKESQALFATFENYNKDLRNFYEKIKVQKTKAIDEDTKKAYNIILTKILVMRPVLLIASKDAQDDLQAIWKTARLLDQGKNGGKGSLEKELDSLLEMKKEIDARRQELKQQVNKTSDSLKSIAKKSEHGALIDAFAENNLLRHLLPPEATSVPKIKNWLNTAKEELRDMSMELPPLKGETEPRQKSLGDLLGYRKRTK